MDPEVCGSWFKVSIILSDFNHSWKFSTPCHKGTGGNGCITLHVFLTSLPDKDKWLASQSSPPPTGNRLCSLLGRLKDPYNWFGCFREE